MDIKKGGGKRGKSKGDDTAAAAAAAESEGEMEVGAVPKNKKREKSKGDDAAAAAAAPKGEMKVGGVPKSENETQKRMKIWEPSTELTKGFLESLGVDKAFLENEWNKLKDAGVGTVGALVGQSKEELKGDLKLSLGSVGAIMEFISQQKGKQNLQEMTQFCSEKIH